MIWNHVARKNKNKNKNRNRNKTWSPIIMQGPTHTKKKIYLLLVFLVFHMGSSSIHHPSPLPYRSRIGDKHSCPFVHIVSGVVWCSKMHLFPLPNASRKCCWGLSFLWVSYTCVQYGLCWKVTKPWRQSCLQIPLLGACLPTHNQWPWTIGIIISLKSWWRLAKSLPIEFRWDTDLFILIFFLEIENLPIPLNQKNAHDASFFHLLESSNIPTKHKSSFYKKLLHNSLNTTG